MIRTILPTSDYKALEKITSADIYIFRFNSENIGEDITEFSEESISMPKATYARLVSACVHVRYNADAETAVIANIIAEPESEERQAEFQAYQQWREYCKKIVKEYYDAQE